MKMPTLLSPPPPDRLLGGLDWLGGALFHVEVSGLEHLPEGRALLVMNHAFGFDAAFFMARIHMLTGRRVWALGEHAWWKVPGLRDLARAAGTVDGTQDNADRLLSAGELVLVLPGGLRESMKPRELRYRLLWGGRYGFVRAAMRSNAPIVPVASLGSEDVFSLIGNAFSRARSLHVPFPIPRPALFPHLKAIRYVIGEPIPVSASASANASANANANANSDAEDAAARRLRRETEGAIHEMFEDQLASQVGFPNHSHSGHAFVSRDQ
jgi:1-acyl-sn-glycerol-3-phosphate acyltransferase